MPTEDQIRRRVEEFEKVYPDSLPDRLTWWARALGIDRVRLFRLLGLTGPTKGLPARSDLPGVIAAHEDQAEVVDEMLNRLLASFDYDLPACRAALHRPVGPESGERRRVARRPGEVVSLPYTPRAGTRSGILLNEILAGGPSALPALLAYLSEPGNNGNGRRGGAAG